jgi:uncharacterized radical SAM superfamily Fe-S cluster-containing enzyme
VIASAGFHPTRSYCCDCGEEHAAELRQEGQGVVMDVVDCPHRPPSAAISSNAATFRAIRARSAHPAPVLPTVRGFSWINFLEITRDCNCSCPVCYADAGPGGGGYLTLTEVERIADRLAGEGLKAISITGGEPTLHPELLAIIGAVRRRGLDATLISNGLRIGRDPTLVRSLRAAGLTYLYLQLDSLRPEVCKRIRGDELVELRQRALKHAVQSGIPFGTDTTVVQDNLDELGALLTHATRYAPNLNLVTFLPVGTTGRYELDGEDIVDREHVIEALVRSGAVEGLTADHAWPFPRFAPIGIDVHPDCGVLLPLALDAGRLRPLDDYVDVAALFARMKASEGPIDRTRAAALFSYYFMRAVRPRKLPALLRMLAGTVTRRGDSSIVTVVVEQFCHPQRQDEERLDRCTTCVVLRDGSRVPLCVYQHADPRRARQTRAAASAAARAAKGA